MGKNFFKRIVQAPFKIVREVAKPVVKILPKSAQKLLPTIGTLAGGFFGGPMGAALGGALGGAASGGRHPMDHALGGGLLGLGHGIISPMLGQAMGLNPNSFMARATMMNSSSPLNALGIPGFSESSFANQRMANMAAAESGNPMGGGGGGILGGLFGGGGRGILGGLGGLLGGGGGGLLNAALLATSLGGSLRAKKKNKPQQNETLDEAIRRSGRPSSDHFKDLKGRNTAQFPPRRYRGTDWNYFPTPEEQQEQLERVNEELANIPRFSKGGQVKGYYKGKNGGQSDKRLIKLPEKSFIVDATTVSLAGDGNSEKGAKVARDWVDSFQSGDFIRQPNKNKVMRAYVSDGEFKIMPEELRAIGSGSIEKGVKIVNDMRKGIRKHKGVEKFHPPKSKPLSKYAGIKG